MGEAEGVHLRRHDDGFCEEEKRSRDGKALLKYPPRAPIRPEGWANSPASIPPAPRSFGCVICRNRSLR